MESTVRYKKVINNKSRYITTYKNNSIGRKLRKKHNTDLNTLNNTYENIKCSASYAYQKEISTKDMILQHKNSIHFLKFDIKSFFESIDLNILNCILNDLFIKKFDRMVIKECKILNKMTSLAIGLKPSAVLANIYLNSFDHILFETCNNLNLTYSRYSDDIVISSKISFDVSSILNLAIAELDKLNLKLKESKTQIINFNNHTDHIKILGSNIIFGQNGNYITISRKYKNKTKSLPKNNTKKGRQNYINYHQH